MASRSSREDQVVSHPEIANETSLLQNIAEYVPTWISQSYSGQQEEHKERVLWAKFQQLDSNSRIYSQDGAEVKGIPPPLILVLGYSTGYSVWTVRGDTGEALEVTAQYTGGQVRLVTLLQTPDKDLKDNHSTHRPLLAVVPKPYDTLIPLSLREGKNLGKKCHISFKTGKQEQGGIVNIVSNARYVVVVLQSRITVLDAGNLSTFLFYVKNQYPTLEYPCNPVAMGTQWLAYSSNSIDTHNQSQGGVFNDQGGSVKAKVLDTMGGLYRVISNYWKGEHSGDLQPPAHQSHTPGQNNSVVTVLDIRRTYETLGHKESGVVKVDLKKMDRDSGVIAHFLAYQEQDRRIVAMSFDPSGMLLITACSEGRVFNLFKILPHPWQSSETCVQHLYKLRRGDTTGIVQSVAFSTDSRWVAVSTLRGTTHVFPITPFGGPITKRTHLSSRMVNRSGKFHITAGLTDPKLSSSVSQLPEPTYSSDITFSLHHLGNPHVLSLFEKPLEVFPLVQIKQPSIPPAASDMEGGHSPKSKQRISIPQADSLPGHVGVVISAVFAETRGKWKDSSHGSRRQEPVKNPAVSSLYVVAGNSVLTEHVLIPRVAKDAKGKDDSNARTGPDDAPIEVDTIPRLCWNLLRPATAKPCYWASKDCNPLLDLADDSRCDNSVVPEEWLANVEVLTHEEPPRRLWMGPQFVMKTYEHAPVDWELPKDSLSVPSNKEEEDQPASMAVLPTDKDGDLLLQTLHSAKSISSKPMLIPRGREEEEDNVIDTGPSSLGPEFVECYGSWKDHMPSKNGFHLLNVSKELEEAMKDSPKVLRKGIIPMRLVSNSEDEFQDTLSQ